MKGILDFIPARQKTANEWATACPSCGGTDRFLIWPERGDTGRFMCRGCGASGDGIDFLRTFEDMSYPEACKALEVTPRDKRVSRRSTPSPKPTRQKEAQTELPPEAWAKAATVFLADCQAAFLKSPEAVATICGERFIGENAALACGLGWNDRDRYFMRETWGLPLLQGREKIIVPKGLIISTMRDGKVVALTIRCTDDRPKDRPRYWQIVGSSKVPFVISKVDVPVFLMESALDAVLTYQEGEGRVACVATMGSSKPFDTETRAFIEQSPKVVCCPDTDEAGSAAWSRWREEFPKAMRISPVGAKDLTEMHKLATLQHLRGEQRTVPFIGEWLRIALEIA